MAKRPTKALPVPEVDPEALASLVEEVLRRKPSHGTLERLRKLKGQAVPALVEALRDPRALRPVYGDALSEESPLAVLLDLLDDFAPAEAVGPLAPAVRHRNVEFRKEAAYALGNIASDDCLGPLARSLKDKNEHVVCYALMGVQRGLEAGRGSRAFRAALFAKVKPLLKSAALEVQEFAPVVLLRLDPDKATEVLLGDKVLTPANDGLWRVLEALRRAEVALPPERLLALEGKLRPSAQSGWRAYGELLLLLARARAPGVEEILQRTKRAVPGLGEYVAAAQAALADLPDPLASIRHRNYSSLNDAQRHYLSVYLLDRQVNEGGFDQYFFNSAGDHADDALQGLKAIGAPKSARVLERAMATFAGGPEPGCARRRQQPFDTRKLDSLSSRYGNSGEAIGVLLFRYALRHKQDFRDAGTGNGKKKRRGKGG